MKKMLCVLLAALLLVSLFAGCGSSSTSSSSTSTSTSTETSTASEEATAQTSETAEAAESSAAEASTEAPATTEAAAEEVAVALVSYPLGDKSETITFWTTIPGNQTSILPDGYNGHFLIDTIESALGVNLEITSVSQIGMGDSTDFNLMIASGDWPDILNVTSYNGGLAQAYNDDVIIEITDEMLANYAPDYYSLLMSLDEQDIRAAQTEGVYYALYSIVADESAASNRGMVIRTDWLEELGLSMPSTVDELTEILLAFKTAYNPTYTYFIEADADLVYMCAAFNTDTVGYYNDGSLPVYIDNGEVKVSWVTDEYRVFLEWFVECYNAGIFESSFYSTASDQSSDRYAYLLNGQIGVYEDSPTSIADWKQYALDGETVEVSFFPNLTDENGNNSWGSEQTIVDSSSAMSIMSTCKNVELALEVMNFFFTDEGAVLANYGEEGYSFTYASDGSVEYSDLIMNSEYQLSMRALHGLYVWNLFPFKTYSDALYPMYTDEVIEALEIMSTGNITAEHFYPSSISLTTSESDAIVTTVTDICTYCQEHILKFMVGDTPLTDENWNAFVNQLYAYGLQDAIDTYQNAYDEYLAGVR